MSKASSLSYKLRPNKAVDRELFLDLLSRLAGPLRLDRYEYVGLGGPFLEDFRVIHARLGVSKMVCVESEESVHHRQRFNCPVPSIECVHSTLEDYLDSKNFDDPAIIWFDYTDPHGLTDQIERFARTIGEVPLNSILRITLNSNPGSLGKPDANEVSVRLGDASPETDTRPTEQEWRLSRFRERMGNMFPSDLHPEGMTFKQFGKSVLAALRIAVDRESLNHADRKVVWTLATHYADGQPMVTATLIVAAVDDERFDSLIDDWPFASTLEDPLKLDMPALSTIERHTLETVPDAAERMGYSLPKSDMGENPYTSFKRFYRMYPQFARVDL
jgi:hypothetical protein